MLQLRPYQNQIINQARELMLAGEKSMLICSPTGSGKTALTAHMLGTAAKKNMGSWFVVHRRELIHQSMRAFDKAGVFHGVIANNFITDARPKVQIASIGTLVNRFDRMKKPKLIIWDEAHHIAAKSWAKIFKQFPDSFHIGLTATPERLDGRGLREYFNNIIMGPSVSWLIENGYLSKYKLFAPTEVNLSGIHTRMGDYVKSELSSIIDKPTITGDAIREYKKQCDGARAIVFGVSIEHSNHVTAQFNSAGIAAASVDGESSIEHRDWALREFQNGKIKVLSNVDLFGEGFDVPSLECVIDLAPTQSLAKALQRWGRALRPSPGKEHAIILDHVGNIMRHGLPDDERNWSLDGCEVAKRDSEKVPSVKVCPKCFAAQPSGKPACLFCGNPFEIQSREVEYRDGELEQIDPKLLKRQARQEQGITETFNDLVLLGKKRGYKKPYAWAQHIFQARQRKRLGI